MFPYTTYVIVNNNNLTTAVVPGIFKLLNLVVQMLDFIVLVKGQSVGKLKVI